MSSKRTVARFRDVVGVSGELADKETNKRDPRFDSLCGNFDQKVGGTGGHHYLLFLIAVVLGGKY